VIALWWCLWQRELRLALRRPSEAALPLAFFALAALLLAIALGPEPQRLRAAAPGVLWVAALLAALQPLPALFAADHGDGTLEQALLAPGGAFAAAVAKSAAHWSLTGLPLALAAWPAAAMLALPAAAALALGASLLLGTPVLSLLGTTAAALTLGLRQPGLLIAVLVLPLAVPVLVLGQAMVAAVEAGQPASAPASLLAALLIFTALVAPPAAAAALRLSME
jgi:heme exporter protein B